MTEIPSKDRMIAAAVTLFARAGFNGVTTKEIAKSANVSEGNIFRYFPTKLDLFLAALESELQKLSVPSEELARIANAEGSRTALRAVLELISGNMVKQPELVRLLHFSALEFKSDIEPMFRRHVYPIFEALSTCRQKESCDHSLCDVRPMTTSLFFVANVMLLQDLFPSFCGHPMPFESVESAAATYAELWCQVICSDAKDRPADCLA
jgi:AcrR family transcriptional regulator